MVEDVDDVDNNDNNINNNNDDDNDSSGDQDGFNHTVNFSLASHWFLRAAW